MQEDLPFGRYYLQEIATDSHYLLRRRQVSVTFEYAGQETQTVKLTANNGKPIVNKLIYGSISGLKVDEKDKPLRARPWPVRCVRNQVYKKRADDRGVRRGWKVCLR